MGFMVSGLLCPLGTLFLPAVLSCSPSGPRFPPPHRCPTRALSRESLRSNQKGCPEISLSQEELPCVAEVREGFSRWKAGQAEGSGAEMGGEQEAPRCLAIGVWVGHPDT